MLGVHTYLVFTIQVVDCITNASALVIQKLNYFGLYQVHKSAIYWTGLIAQDISGKTIMEILTCLNPWIMQIANSQDAQQWTAVVPALVN